MSPRAPRGTAAAQPGLFDEPTPAADVPPVAAPTPAAEFAPYAPPAGDAVRAFEPLGALPHGITLLEASAGTGKTYSIATLVLRLVAEEGLAIGEILVVTFTEAATTELRERVRRRLRDAHAVALAVQAGGLDALGRRPEAVTEHLVRTAHAAGRLAETTRRLRTALEQFDDAPISTIHGFCARVLREWAFECGAEFDGELLGDDAELVEEVVRDFWACESARRPVEVVRQLAAQKVALDTLLDLGRRALRHRDAECAPDCPEPVAFEGLVAARANAVRRLQAIAQDPDCDAYELLHAAVEAEALSKVSWSAEKLERRVRALNAWLAGDPFTLAWDGDVEHFGTARLLKATKKGHACPEHALFAAVQTLLDVDAQLDATSAQELLVLRHACVRWVRAEVARRKAARRQHGYDDLLRLVRDALRRDAGARDADDAPGASDGPLARALRAGFRAALIDEFQDTDAVQWEIFRRAFGAPGHRLLLIGDPKQAIYAFRGADIRTYLAAREAAADRRALDRNWRTDAPLVDALQALVGAHPNPFGEPAIRWRAVSAHHDARRLRGAPDGDASLVVRFLPRDGVIAPRGKQKCIARGTLQRHLPHWVAADVVRFLASGATIADGPGGAARPVKPSDVAVLVRTNRQARAVQAALRSAGVPAVVHGAASVFATREAEELAALLAAVLEPGNPRLLRAALGTDLLGIVAGVELRADDGTAPLGPGDALARLADAAPAASDAWDGVADVPSLDRWAERMRRWRAAWRGERDGASARARTAPSVLRLVRAVVDELALPERMLALEDGERRLTNVLHLAEVVHAAAVADGLEPGATLAWLREQITLGDACRDDETRQLRLESDAEAAQVVTIHSSKGLEYGAVWCPYLWDGDLARKEDRDHPCLPGADGRPALRLVSDEAAGARLDDDVFAEGLRLAYVALTRARHRLTLWWGAVNGQRTGFECSPLAWLLHGPAADGCDDPRAARAWLDTHVEGMPDDALRARLAALRDGAPTLLAVREEEVGQAPTRVRWQPPAAAPRPLAARPWPRTAPLDDGWRLGSFTGLTAGAHAAADDAAPGEGTAAELPEALADARDEGRAEGRAERGIWPDASRDEGAGEEQPNALEPDAEAPVPLAEFPASAAAGIFFHEVLERHDVAARDALPAEVARALDAHGFDATARARWTTPVADALQALLDAPLAPPAGLIPGAAPAPLRLGDVPRRDRLVELRFELPAVGASGAPITPQALARCFADHPGGALDAATLARYAARVGALGFRPLRGFLTGAIDLVLRHDGRWWLLDYKSNRLGAHPSDYRPARLLDEMTHAHYVLQYHLYALALHRWLRLRVADYDWDRHVGGACYVFLRAMGTGDAPDGALRGVFFDRPPRGRIEALDRLFAEGA